MQKDFLVELGCEELPPKTLKILGQSFLSGIEKGLKEAGLAYEDAKFFATPRRLAVSVNAMAIQQADRVLSVDGPPVKAAFDANGNPTPAALGFAKKNGVDISALDQSGEKLRLSKSIKGESAVLLLPGIVKKALEDLPISKRMRWGSSRLEFVRPTQWLLMVMGNDVIPCTIMGQAAGNLTKGHRFHASETFPIGDHVGTTGNLRHTYELNLRHMYVIADFEERRDKIRSTVEELARQQGGQALMPDALLDEVTSLVEWPVPLVCSFEERFLAVPQEALISTMQDNQKYFCLVTANGKLLPRFITVTNIKSTDPEKIIAGNEKVVRPRLTDAEFFFKQDKKVRLESRNERLKTVVFQAELGTVFEKAERVAALAAVIADKVGGNVEWARRAGILSKADLASEMVGEFPELQGIAGFHYATHDGEAVEVAEALNEQYQPRFAGDELPGSKTGQAVALADKLDTLTGIFGIGQPPTGSRDPFALRRAAIGLLRIAIEKNLALDLPELIAFAAQQQGGKLSNKTVEADVFEFLLGRYRAMYEEQGIAPDVIQAVQVCRPRVAADFDQRVKAVAHFRALPEAASLAAANKRVSNILAKEPADSLGGAINPGLLTEAAEKQLATSLQAIAALVEPLFADGEYTAALAQLASLKEPVDAFFDRVMVMADDVAVRRNRLNMLWQLRQLFLRVADVSQLQA
jgi:glycyl-tRNA synthetase beta chain